MYQQYSWLALEESGRELKALLGNEADVNQKLSVDEYIWCSVDSARRCRNLIRHQTSSE